MASRSRRLSTSNMQFLQTLSPRRRSLLRAELLEAARALVLVEIASRTAARAGRKTRPRLTASALLAQVGWAYRVLFFSQTAGQVVADACRRFGLLGL